MAEIQESGNKKGGKETGVKRKAGGILQTAGRRQDNRRSRAADWVFQGIWLEADAEGAYPKGN